MKTWKAFVLGLIAAIVVAAIGAFLFIHRGFRATNRPLPLEAVVARTARDFSIPSVAKTERNPLEPTPQNLQDGRDDFLAKCQTCHGRDGSGLTPVGQSLYPRVPDLRAAPTQNLTDGELHYIIENGVELTGMPAWGNPHQVENIDGWKLVLYIRSLRPLTQQEQTQQTRTSASAHYVGSQACQKCHADIYERWQKTPMANVVRDPRQHPDAIIPDLATNTMCTSFRKIKSPSFTEASGSNGISRKSEMTIPITRSVGSRKQEMEQVSRASDWRRLVGTVLSG